MVTRVERALAVGFASADGIDDDFFLLLSVIRIG